MLDQDDPDGFSRGTLVKDSLMACQKIGSNATTIEQAKEDPKVNLSE